MRAVLLDRPGSPDTLRIGDLPVPEPGAGALRVRVHATSLNPVDYKVAALGYPDWNYPHVLGVDGAGVVDAASPEVDGDWHPGDRVFITPPGENRALTRNTT